MISYNLHNGFYLFPIQTFDKHILFLSYKNCNVYHQLLFISLGWVMGFKKILNSYFQFPYGKSSIISTYVRMVYGEYTCKSEDVEVRVQLRGTRTLLLP